MSVYTSAAETNIGRSSCIVDTARTLYESKLEYDRRGPKVFSQQKFNDNCRDKYVLTVAIAVLHNSDVRIFIVYYSTPLMSS